MQTRELKLTSQMQHSEVTTPVEQFVLSHTAASKNVTVFTLRHTHFGYVSV